MTPSCLYTGKGDKGATTLYDGSKVSKADSLRIRLLGEVDMLVSMIGADIEAESRMACVNSDLDSVMRNLMCFSTYIATPIPRTELSKRQCAYTPNIKDVEKAIDDYDVNLTSFILPIGHFHVARAQAR